MFYEDVKLVSGDTVWQLAIAYGYKGPEWTKIWNDPKNAALVAKRGKPEKLQVGDVLMIPIPWKVISKSLVAEAHGAGFEMKRDGEAGKRLGFVQTVYRHNQPIGPNPNPFCVDACTPDDNLPFYWTEKEIKDDPSLRTTFIDHPSRNNPTVGMGTTKWRAVVSISVQTEKRVTVWDSWVWGFDLTPAGAVSTIGPRAATAHEIEGHMNLLRKGVGTSPDSFSKQGWTFRRPPA